MNRALRVLVPSGFLALVLVSLESDAALSIRAPNPMIVLSVCAALLALVLNWRSGTAQLLVAGLLPFLILALIRFAYWPPRKLLLVASDAVKPGMTADQARSAMAGFHEGTGWPGLDGGGQLEVAGALVFHGDGQGGDWIVINIDGGVVTRVRFEPD